MPDRPSLYVLDAYSIIFQVFHAIPEMTGPGGRPTNAVFGIFRDLLNLRKNQKPNLLAAAFDGPGPVFRSEIDANYKAQRGEMPADLVDQIPVIRRVFEGFRVPILEYSGAEADDVIATITHRAVERGLDVFICTADKDARQLLNDHVRIVNLRKALVMDPAALEADWGIRPDQVVDLLSLTGDSVDNVPGVPGIGVKTAAELLRTFGTLDNLLNNIAKVSGTKRKENLYLHSETALHARRLIELKTDLPIQFDWEAMRETGYDSRALKELCTECGFHGFRREIVDEAPARDDLFQSAEPTGPTAVETKGPGPGVPSVWATDRYEVVETPEALERLAGRLRERRRFSFDTETTSVDPLRAELVGMSFALEPGEAYYLPVKAPEGERVLGVAVALKVLGPILSDPEVELVGQNLKYDMLVLSQLGVELRGAITDTMVLSYLLESGERNHNLDDLSRRLLDHAMIPISDLIGKGKNQITMDRVPVSKVAEYAGEDADAALRLEGLLTPRVKEEGLWGLYTDLERPLIQVLAKMETNGIKVDVDLLRGLSKDFEARLGEIRSQIYELAGHEFNIASTLQLRKVLFEELKLKPPPNSKTDKGEQSTNAEVLEILALSHPLPRLIVQHRQLDKLKGTYLDALPELVHADGRIHTSFNQVVAATGRLSSSDPNLQNIPARTEDGRQIRQAFVAPGPGWTLLTADYSQIELRVLAHFCRDPELMKAFEEDQDIHAAVAAGIFGVDESSVTKEQRRVAKTVNFGVIYGISPFGLATRLGIATSEAAAFIDAYFKRYSGVARFMMETLETTRDTGRVETILGRRRNFKKEDFNKVDYRNLRGPGRAAVNAVIQGSAADLMKRAMLDVDREMALRGLASRMLLQIHDELVFEVPETERLEMVSLVEHAMSNALALDVPVRVDVSTGPNWLDVSPV